MISKILFALAFFASLTLAAYQLIRGAGFNIGVWFPPLYFALLLAAAYARLPLEKALRTLYKPAMRAFYAAMALFCIAFIIVCAYIISYAPPYIHGDPDLLIVLGARTIGYEPSTILASRLDAAAAALERHPDMLSIMAGGQGPDAITAEANVMRLYLERHGIGAERILMENRSSNTFENLLFSRRILDLPDGARIIILTSEFHIPRAMMLARRIFPGAQLYAAGSSSPFHLFSAGITREFFAFAKSFIFDRE